MSPFDQWLLGAIFGLLGLIGAVVKWAFTIQAKVDSLQRHEVNFIKSNWNPHVEEFRRLHDWKVANFGRNGDHLTGVTRHLDP